jgi:LacI family transcriptional regulator
MLIIPAANSDLGSRLDESIGGLPIVCLDRAPLGWTGDLVLVANRAGARNAAKHLIELGHRELAVITGPARVSNAMERLNGFKDACADAGIPIRPEFIHHGSFDTRTGLQAGKRLFRMLPRPTAIFACNDLIALGVLHAAQEEGLNCPEDFSLVGFDSLEFCDYTSPALTSVYQPGYQLGATAAALVIDRIQRSGGAAQQLTLETELRLRCSVLPLSAMTPSVSRRLQPRIGGRRRSLAAKDEGNHR